MALQGVIEPVEEVGYRHRPPLLEDVSIEGPLRRPISDSLATLEQRDAIEEDYNWWRYSKFAAPWLVFMLLLLITVFTLTAFTQVGDLKRLRDGRPRYYQLDRDSDLEAGQHLDNRNVRIAATVIGISAVLLSLFVLAIRPLPLLRKILHFGCALLLLATAVLAFVSIGIGEDESSRQRDCFELQLITNESCRTRPGIANAALVLDLALAISALFAAVVVGFSAFVGDFRLGRKGWREQERDIEREKTKKKKEDTMWQRRYQKLYEYQRATRTRFCVLFLALVFFFSTILIILLILMHLDHDVVRLRARRGRSSILFDQDQQQPFEESGWPVVNTRLRYAWTAIGIITVLVNFIPWRTRVLAYIFGFVYFLLGVLSLVSFGLDVHDLRDVHDNGCPTQPGNIPYQGLDSVQVPLLAAINTRVNCVNSEFIATVVIEFIFAVAVLIYLLNEYILRMSSVHSGRKYPWHQIRSIEQKLDSRRPVRCELTSKVMTAKEYYYRHRFTAGPQTVMGSRRSSMSGSAFPIW